MKYFNDTLLKRINHLQTLFFNDSQLSEYPLVLETKVSSTAPLQSNESIEQRRFIDLVSSQVCSVG